MKLSKGKIKKLYSNKKQTAKRRKMKRRISRQRKTFRKNRKLHLARKTLKQYKGGDGMDCLLSLIITYIGW